MITRNSLEEGVSTLRLEAMDWVSRLGFGRVSEADRHACAAWRAQSPAHDDAYRTASAYVDHLRQLAIRPDDLPTFDNVAPLRPSRPALMGRRAFIGGGAVAASLAAGVFAAGSPLGLWPNISELMADERTAPGQRRSFSPVAGVDVELNSRSSASRIAGGVQLVSGEVFVSLAAQQAGFRVDAGDGVARATHGAFGVRNYDGELCISCVEGSLVARVDGRDVALSSGEAITWRKDAGLARASVDAPVDMAWRRGLLIFDETPLVTAVAQLNRYYPGRIVLRSAAHRDRPVTGLFHIDRIEQALVQIERLEGVRTTHLPGGVILIA